MKNKIGILIAIGIFGILFFMGCVSTDSSSVTEPAAAVDPSVLTGNLWQEQNNSSQRKYYRFFEDGFVMYATSMSLSESFGDFNFETVDYSLKWQLGEGKLAYNSVNGSYKYEGNFIDESTIRGKKKGEDLIRVTDQDIIDKYNGSNYNFSPMNLLPNKKRGISDGPSILGFNNPNDYNIAVAVVNGDAACYLVVGSNVSTSIKVPNSAYELYFVMACEPDALYQGDTVSVRNQKVEIKFSAVTDGNYNFKKVE